MLVFLWLRRQQLLRGHCYLWLLEGGMLRRCWDVVEMLPDKIWDNVERMLALRGGMVRCWVCICWNSSDLLRCSNDVEMKLRSCWNVERCVVKIMLRWWDAKIFLRWCWNVERFWYDEMLWDLRCWDVERFWDDKMLWDLRCWYVLEIIRRMLRC